MKIYLNGVLVDKEKAMVSVFDHGLLYGDGVFEEFVSTMDVSLNCMSIENWSIQPRQFFSIYP